MKRILIFILIIVATGLAVAWLLARPSAIEKEIGKQTWTLVRLEVNGEEEPLPKDAPATFEPMAGRRYVGNAGVNSYEVHLVIDRHGEIRFTGEGGGVTEMAGPPHLMAFEAVYLAAFWKIQTAEISGSKLVLKGPGVQLDYEGKPTLPLDDSGSPEDTVSNSVQEENN